jgi:hypothetical protein
MVQPADVKADVQSERQLRCCRFLLQSGLNTQVSSISQKSNPWLHMESAWSEMCIDSSHPIIHGWPPTSPGSPGALSLH